ncbi:MAG: AtpZ/AtpI family protein [Pyrinomonadaceae bacterium]
MRKNFLDSDQIEDEPRKRSGGEVISLLSVDDAAGRDRISEERFVLSGSQPESAAETMRRSGLAYSAGIAFFASVVFMLVIGWGADLLLGSSPWGIVGGIVLGSIIGFVQFFRISSRIFKPDQQTSRPKTLFDDDRSEK